MLIDMHMLLAPLVLILQMHTDMGDERGIRLRCISLGRAALRGSRMRGMAICSKVSEPCFARSSLSIARFSVGAARPQHDQQNLIYDILSFQTDSSNPPTLPLSVPRPSDSTVTLCFCAVGRVVTMTTHRI